MTSSADNLSINITGERIEEVCDRLDPDTKDMVRIGLSYTLSDTAEQFKEVEYLLLSKHERLHEELEGEPTKVDLGIDALVVRRYELYRSLERDLNLAQAILKAAGA